MNKLKLLEKIVAGPKNVQFNDMVPLVEAFTDSRYRPVIYQIASGH